MLGLFGEFKPRFVKRYADLAPRWRRLLPLMPRTCARGAFPVPSMSMPLRRLVLSD